MAKMVLDVGEQSGDGSGQGAGLDPNCGELDGSGWGFGLASGGGDPDGSGWGKGPVDDPLHQPHEDRNDQVR